MPIRQPIISVLAHVDHGKTTLLDYIRGTAVVRKEAGGITQHIGASEVPATVIKQRCSALLKKWNIKVKIPGLLFIDTPGHEAFTLLRKRGGALADIAVLLIDITEGVKPQTVEAINILKSYRTPFIVAANKIDKISGWNVNKDACFLDSLSTQHGHVKTILDTKIYELIGQLAEHGITAERFDRVTDFTKTVAIVPISAKTGEGIPELLALITGLVQKYLEKNIEIDPAGMGKGVILELKEAKGMGMVADVILYDGVIKKSDLLVIGGLEDDLVTKVKAILKTMPMKEMRVERQFVQVDEVVAAAGIRVVAPELERAVAGAPIRSVRRESEIERARREVRQEIESVDIKTSPEGVVIKADTLGGLEALAKMLDERDVPIRRFGIGTVSKKDVVWLEEMPPEYKVVFAFNVSVSDEAEEQAKNNNVFVIQERVIYRLIEKYEEYLESLEEKKRTDVLSKITLPAKIRFLPEFVFRQSNPAIIGVEVLAGTLRQKVKLMDENGKSVGLVHAIQKMGENVDSADVGERVAISVDGGVVDRNLKRGAVLYTALSRDEYRLLKKNENLLKDHQKMAMNEIADIMRKKDRFWDVEV